MMVQRPVCRRPAGDTSQFSKFGTGKVPSPKAGTEHRRRAACRRGRAGLPNSPSFRPWIPNSLCRRGSAACGNTGDAAEDTMASAAATLTRNLSTRTSSLLPHRQLLSGGQYHMRVLLRTGGIASVFCESCRFDGDLVTDLHRVALPATSDESVRRAHFNLETLDGAALILAIDEDKGVGVHPIHLRDGSGNRCGSFRIILRIK